MCRHLEFERERPALVGMMVVMQEEEEDARCGGDVSFATQSETPRAVRVAQQRQRRVIDGPAKSADAAAKSKLPRARRACPPCAHSVSWKTVMTLNGS
ncbi:hypothetical protein MTO96_027653 [Rhipicephalus appendiculatus]